MQESKRQGCPCLWICQRHSLTEHIRLTKLADVQSLPTCCLLRHDDCAVVQTDIGRRRQAAVHALVLQCHAAGAVAGWAGGGWCLISSRLCPPACQRFLNIVPPYTLCLKIGKAMHDAARFCTVIRLETMGLEIMATLPDLSVRPQIRPAVRLTTEDAAIVGTTLLSRAHPSVMSSSMQRRSSMVPTRRTPMAAAAAASSAAASASIAAAACVPCSASSHCRLHDQPNGCFYW